VKYQTPGALLCQRIHPYTTRTITTLSRPQHHPRLTEYQLTRVAPKVPDPPRIHINLTPSPSQDSRRRHPSLDDTIMSTPYETRANDNGKSKKQSMAELKLRRLTELNQRLQEDLNRRRIPVSEAAME